MKILHTKISNSAAYLLLVFAIASVALLFYGQFSNLEFETINNTSTEVSPISNTVSSDEVFVEESDMMTPEIVEPLAE